MATYKKSEQTKKILEETIIKQFKEKGFSNTSVRDIAKESNLTYSLVYYYYSDGLFSVANKLKKDFGHKCMDSLNKHFKTNDWLLYHLTLLRFMMREYLLNEDDYVFYIESWRSLDVITPNTIDIFTIAYNENCHASTEKINQALIASDSLWSGLYAGKRKGIISPSDEEIRDATDIARWTYLGLSEEYVKSKIKKAYDILTDIPIEGIKIL